MQEAGLKQRGLGKEQPKNPGGQSEYESYPLQN